MVDKLIADGKIVLEKTIGGENIVLVYRFVDTDILITLRLKLDRSVTQMEMVDRIILGIELMKLLKNIP